MLKASKYEASHKIRFLRVVVDYNVDRMQVYRQRCHSRALLIARTLSLNKFIVSTVYTGTLDGIERNGDAERGSLLINTVCLCANTSYPIIRWLLR